MYFNSWTRHYGKVALSESQGKVHILLIMVMNETRWIIYKVNIYDDAKGEMRGCTSNSACYTLNHAYRKYEEIIIRLT